MKYALFEDFCDGCGAIGLYVFCRPCRDLPGLRGRVPSDEWLGCFRGWQGHSRHFREYRGSFLHIISFDDMTGGAFYWNLAPDVPNGFECDRDEARARWPGGVPDCKPVMSLSN